MCKIDRHQVFEYVKRMTSNVTSLTVGKMLS